MRTLVLILLWLGVAGFGLMTLCSGIFVPMAPVIALPIGLVTGGLGWLCWTKVRALGRQQGSDAPAEPPQP